MYYAVQPLSVGQIINNIFEEGFGIQLQSQRCRCLLHHLCISLMEFWQSKYDNRIYNHYEKITTEQENETRKLIKHLGLNWESTCLSHIKTNAA